uniref:leucine--tRNA ligase n=1 Tax=Trichobilharzia regenti TaxID=157069 RepID=A0AA85K5D1_TRIRE|nr:unnamed protein product [Trichobilharzia regenti]
MFLKFRLYRCYISRKQHSYCGLNDLQAVEKKWLPIIRKIDADIGNRNALKCRQSFVLSMFPYPSGSLHMGHLRVYTVSDVLARYKMMCGEATIYPMGWDSFGLPAENAAIDRDEFPLDWTNKNILSMKQQMNETMSLTVDWSRELSTCDPNYYKWTQWIFLKLFQSGLAYHRSAYVNWDPIDKTVLADELIDSQGRSWRSGAKVERRPLRQWFFRTTAYSKSLLDGLKDIENNEWRDVVNLQRGWLGNLNGTQIEFDVISSDERQRVDPRQHQMLYSPATDGHSIRSKKTKDRLVVFTKYPSLAVADLISYIRVGSDSVYFADMYRKPEEKRVLNFSRKLVLHSDWDNLSNANKLSIASCTSVSPWPEVLDVSVRHPLTGRSIPMIRDNIPLPKHSRAYPNELVFSLHGQTPDLQSELLDIPLSPGKLSYGIKDSSKGNELNVSNEDELNQCVINTPISELHGKTVGESTNKAMQMLKPVPVPEDQLPVVLPPLDNALKRGDEPLKHNESWRKTTCPKCGNPANRETDTLDTFVDSSWYYLRYLDPNNTKVICDREKAAESLPVDVYVGGIEHAIRHLYYARFIAHFLYDLNILPCREPFRRFLPVGLVLGQTYIEPQTGRFIPSVSVEKISVSDKKVQYYEKATNTPVEMYWDKMSKSKLNGIDPAEIVSKYGMDLVRITMLSNVGPHRARKWTEGDVIQGVINWLTKMNRIIDQLIEFSVHAQNSNTPWELKCGLDDPLLTQSSSFLKFYESVIRRVNGYYDETFIISAVIARLHELTDLIRRSSVHAGGPGPSSFLYLRALADLLVMLAPVSPIYASELWSGLQCALSTNAPSTIHEILSSHSNKMMHSSDDWFNHWPYDLEKHVLEQPFPKIRQQDSHISVEDDNHSNAGCFDVDTGRRRESVAT